MKKLLIFTKDKLAFFVAIAVAAAIGGATTAIVSASIPDSSGTIHGCYRNAAGLFDSKGTLRTINSDTGETCTAQETAVNWSQNSGSPVIRDVNGQVLGNLLDTAGTSINNPWAVYNPTLGRVVKYVHTASGYSIISPLGASVNYTSANCTGQAYTGAGPGIKTDLIRTDASSYGKVQDNAAPQTQTISSVRIYDFVSDSFSCVDVADNSDSVYAITSTSLPFTLPWAEPLKF